MIKRIAITALLLALCASAQAAEPPPDPRLLDIARQRQIVELRGQLGQLLIENANLRNRELDREEEKIKAEAKTNKEQK